MGQSAVEIVVIIGLIGLIAGQFFVILGLVNRLLRQAKIPPLEPVSSTHPQPPIQQPDPRRKLFTVPLQD